MLFVFGLVLVIALLAGSFAVVRVKKLKREGKRSIFMTIVAASCYTVALLAWMYLISVFFLLTRIE